MGWNIDKSKCLTCGACVAVCPAAALELSTEIMHDAEKCILCAACEKVCPVGAIKIKK